MKQNPRVFPITINSTTIFNMPVVASLVTLLQQDSLDENNVSECQKVIYNLMAMENKGESLPNPLTSANTGKKSARKDEQYRLMFSELEKFVIAHSSNSPRHHQVLECLMQVRNKPMPVKREAAESEISVAARELDRYQNMSERERMEFNMSGGGSREGSVGLGGVKVEHYGAPSGVGGPQSKKQRMMGLGGKNLLQLYKERLER